MFRQSKDEGAWPFSHSALGILPPANRLADMWLLSFRDLRWRRRRFVTAILGTGLVFAITLIGAGIRAAFGTEVDRVINSVEADYWVIRTGLTGPFTSRSLLPPDLIEAVREAPGVEAAEPIVVFHDAVVRDLTVDVNVFGYEPGGFLEPDQLLEGRVPRREGELVADESLNVALGDEIELGGRSLEVVGLTKGLTYFAGQPLLFMMIEEAQLVGFGGLPLSTAVLMRGDPTRLPEELQAQDRATVKADILRPLKNATITIDLINLLLWIVAASIIGAVLYISTLERIKDFAVMKATGFPTSALMGSVAIEAVVLAVISSLIGLVGSFALLGIFPLLVEIPSRSLVGLPAIAVVVGLAASSLGFRRAVAVDPAAAFGGP